MHRKKTIQLSQEETDFFGLRVYRATITSSRQFAGLRESLKDEHVDVVRAKVRADLLDREQRFYELGIPYFFAGGSIQYEMPVGKMSSYSPHCPHWNTIQFERFNGNQKEFSEILTACWKHDPIGYSRTPLLKQYISKEQELAFLTYYYTRVSYYSYNYIYLLRQGQQYLGFVIYEFQKQDNIVYSPLVGVLPSRKNNSYLSCFVKHSYGFVKALNQDALRCGARLYNFHAQHVFEREGMQKTKILYYYHLLPGIKHASYH